MASKLLFTENALRWLESILEERFGHAFFIEEQEQYLKIKLPGSEKEIELGPLQKVFHQSYSNFKCFSWNAYQDGFNGLVEDELFAPSEINLPEPLVEFSNRGATINYDVLGLTYWMLSRLEEVGRTDLDEHERFPATSSHAYNNGYLERPIVDEWLGILGQVISRVWCGIEIKTNKFKIKVSHDVDSPSRYFFQSFFGLIKAIGSDLLKQRAFKSAFTAPLIWLSKSKYIDSRDPFNTFHWLMRQSENNGLTSAFYFICGRTDTNRDALYDPEMIQIRKLMGEIHQRGHEIGLHPSYNTYNCPDEFASEVSRLKTICSEESINQEIWGGRMHYLRWQQPQTLQLWEDAGMDYDSTLGYADRPGFRCGTCFEYPAFNTVNDEMLSLRIRPLIAMDCTVMADKYLGLGSTENAYFKFKELKDKCRKVKGVYSLLWHNSFFKNEKDFEIYSRLLSADD
ncbi:polysaccharide deacetylase family protein [Idiomarina sp.]|uniref:polysaccharide deacetylase family protein n=1 Tax=Idiomarina sp. TaxID=1874361 RepID=UPI001D43C123|nr:polysaccharide deacetylase family protein [Idiomarina sp.]MCJ8316217.1 polysaccharide deacetylase family protein [Idiomarina sp.]NQZ16130.1 hypothetical protein [Idiomarina sp.]